jgi:hypothetical protein
MGCPYNSSQGKSGAECSKTDAAMPGQKEGHNGAKERAGQEGNTVLVVGQFEISRQLGG